jgi:hypothetical protein
MNTIMTGLLWGLGFVVGFVIAVALLRLIGASVPF